MRNNLISLRKMQLVSCVYLIIVSAGAWYFHSLTAAWSVLAGGVLAVLSFWVSYKDLDGFLQSKAVTPGMSDKDARVQFSKSGYLIKFWIRIAIIGVALLLIIKFSSVNIIGLILGLSTIVFTVTFTAVDIVRHYYFRGRR